MERRVWHPAAAQVRFALLVGEGGGIFPGRLPFIESFPGTRDDRSVSLIRTEDRRSFPKCLRSL
jgi:hypothetical protein